MAKFIAGLFLGLLLGFTAMVTAQHMTTGSGTGAATPGNLLLGTASSSMAMETIISVTQPTSFVFAGKGPHELLRIGADGTVTFQGRVLGSDKEVWDGLRAVFNPGRVCQEWEENRQWLKP